MSDLYYLDPSWLPLWGLLLGLGLAALGWRIVADLRQIRRYRHGLAAQARRLRFGLMVERLGIGLPRYLRRASDADLACRLLVCEHCRTIDRCDLYLSGPADMETDMDPKDFCPNHSKLAARNGSRRRPG